MRKARIVLGIALALLAMGVSTLGAQGMDSVTVRKTASGASYLADAAGMTLYYYAKDKAGPSVCYGGCAKAWPIFYAPSLAVSAPLEAADFASQTRSDGTMQTTYKGWPLYYWQNDAKPGDTTGEGVGKVWYLVDPANFPPAM